MLARSVFAKINSLWNEVAQAELGIYIPQQSDCGIRFQTVDAAVDPNMLCCLDKNSTVYCPTSV